MRHLALTLLLAQLISAQKVKMKDGAHCVQGLCLLLLPGEQVGPVRPGEAMGIEAGGEPVRVSRERCVCAWPCR
jgi:hypothetical protein